MISTKPYLVRAIYEWCVDQGFTPYVAVAVNERTRVPREFVRDGQIVLNIGSDATHQLAIGNDEISFQARFNGVAFAVLVPMEAVGAIYARENGQGMAFDIGAEAEGAPAADEAEAKDEASVEPEAPSRPQPGGGRPQLTRIK